MKHSKFQEVWRWWATIRDACHAVVNSDGGPWNINRCSPECVAKAGDLELRRHCVIRREMCIQLGCDILALPRRCCFLAMWRGASQRVLSAHWLPSVVRSSSGQSVTVRAECLLVLRGKYVLWDGIPSRHKIWLAGRHCWTVCHARRCYQEDFDDTCVKCIHVLCLSISVVSLDPLGLLWINLLSGERSICADAA